MTLTLHDPLGPGDDRYQRETSGVGTKGAAPGQFFEPKGVAVDSQGYVYVADTWNHRIEKFNASFKATDEFPIQQGWESQSIINKLSYVQKAIARSGSVRNLRTQGNLQLSGSYPMFPMTSLPWRVAIQTPLTPAEATFDVTSDWETLAADLVYITFVSLMQQIPTPAGCVLDTFIKSEQGVVFLIEMSPYFDSVIDNLVAGDPQAVTSALDSTLNLLLQELPSV